MQSKLERKEKEKEKGINTANEKDIKLEIELASSKTFPTSLFMKSGQVSKSL